MVLAVGVEALAHQQAVFADIGQADLLAFVEASGVIDLHNVAPSVVPVARLGAAVQSVAGRGLRATSVTPLRTGPHLNLLISFKQE